MFISLNDFGFLPAGYLLTQAEISYRHIGLVLTMR